MASQFAEDNARKIIDIVDDYSVTFPTKQPYEEMLLRLTTLIDNMVIEIQANGKLPEESLKARLEAIKLTLTQEVDKISTTNPDAPVVTP